MIVLEAVESLLHHLGIDPSGNPLENILEVMNFTIQCMGTIRYLFEKLEKQRRANYFTSINNANYYKQLGWQYWAIRKAFSYAAKRMVYEIMLSEEPHNLNPARHIIESFPNSSAIGSKEWLPVHWAILGDIDEHPFLIDEQTFTFADNTPKRNHQLHPPDNTSNNTSVDCDERILVINQLALILPHEFSAKDNEGRTVFHIASRLNSVELFECVLDNCNKCNGSKITDANNNGALPLHNAARFCGSIEVFERVAEAHREAITSFNHGHMLPLHWAAAKNRSVEIVQYLLRAYPEGIKVANEEGYLPSHCSGQNDSLGVVQLINEHYPEGIYIADQEGGVPFQHACCFTHNLAVVRYLYDRYPAALVQPQEDGITPIHLAAAQNDVPNLLTFILQHHEKAAYIQDSVSWLPVYCLVNNIHERKLSLALLDCLRELLYAGPVVNFAFINSLLSSSWLPTFPPGLSDAQKTRLTALWHDCIATLTLTLSPDQPATPPLTGHPHAHQPLDDPASPPSTTQPVDPQPKYHLLVRLVLNTNVAKQGNLRNALYEELNWQARAWGVYLMVHLATLPPLTIAVEGSGDDAESVTQRKALLREYHLLEHCSKRQRIRSTTALSHTVSCSSLTSSRHMTQSAMDQLVDNDCQRVLVLQRLCHCFMAPTQRDIPAGILRKILKFL